MYNSKADKILSTSGSAIGYKNELYSLQDGNTIDRWDYEVSLNRVLDDITQGKEITLDDWVRIAVPFIAGLFVRGKEFNNRYENMISIKGLSGGLLNPDNTNGGRILRLQRQLAPIMAARWGVLHNTNAAMSIISNDLGLVLTQDTASKAVGWAIPLDPATVLDIFPQKMQVIGHYYSGTWYASIEHRSPSATMFQGINEQIARASNEFIFGANKIDIETFKQYTGVDIENKTSIIMEAPWSQTFSGQELIAHERDWRMVASIANLNLSPNRALRYKFRAEDLEANNKWTPPMEFLPANLTEFPSGVGFRNKEMLLNLNLRDDFESHIIRPPKRS